MTSADWSALDYASDPIPGDPAALCEAIGAFRQTATSLSTAVTSLIRVEAGDNFSLAVNEIVDNARDVATILKHAFDRYDMAADALDDYQLVLAQARRQAQEALDAAMRVRADYARAAQHANDCLSRAQQATTPAEQDDALSQYYQAKSGADNAQSSLRQLRHLVDLASQSRHDAGERACRAIDLVLDDKVLSDTRWDQFKEVVDDVGKLAGDLYRFSGLDELVKFGVAAGKWVWDHIDTISTVLSAIALVTAWIPIVGEFTMAAALLAKVAMVVKVIAVVAKLASLILLAKNGIDFAIACAHGDGRGMLAAGAGLVLSLLLHQGSKVAKKGVASMTEKALVKESVEQTGSTAASETALSSVPTKLAPLQRVEDYFGGGSAQSRKIDALVSSMKGSASEAMVDRIKIEGKIASQLVSTDISLLGKAIPDVPQRTPPVPTPYLVTHNACPAPVLAGIQ